ncbi:hypothetical protein K432DRAFT_208935 [Lepidopterella palustris CBS 459.81]|uniref:Uncharacterized protein n=1 Tax=Lepidopterella palustris CBS 459.81 TaxID=1314670 RepID=A0A8E2EF89_9PEZI|nr:hypothetical protein K432DRAFT_208935 [Lepidopterella palustris CBS 459.81]
MGGERYTNVFAPHPVERPTGGTRKPWTGFLSRSPTSCGPALVRGRLRPDEVSQWRPRAVLNLYCRCSSTRRRDGLQ